MSKHFFKRQPDGQPKLTIDVGFDRPMQHFYLSLTSPHGQGEKREIYTSMYDAELYGGD